jgi:hypothetical protein
VTDPFSPKLVVLAEKLARRTVEYFKISEMGLSREEYEVRRHRVITGM